MGAGWSYSAAPARPSHQQAQHPQGTVSAGTAAGPRRLAISAGFRRPPVTRRDRSRSDRGGLSCLTVIRLADGLRRSSGHAPDPPGAALAPAGTITRPATHPPRTSRGATLMIVT